ncbi:MAG TPA: ATP-binding protein [Gaiellales bacterium]|jgi:anti-sigma regulatory factor (Ser/Thr protein kinase)|nr:ATP-binding protein [Gaiellales bacterium]
MKGTELQLVAELVVPADVGMLSLCRTTLVGVVSGLPITDRRLDDLKLVLSEVCGAAMERTHAAEGTVDIGFRRSVDEIEVTVADRGPDPGEGHMLAVQLLEKLCSRIDVGRHCDGPGRVVRFAQRLPA